MRNEDRGWTAKQFEDAELEDHLNKDDTLSRKKMSVMLNIIKQLIFHRSKALGKIQMSGKWVAHELTEVYIENN